jgi:hypothetical protein
MRARWFQPWKWRGDLSHLIGRRDYYVGSDSNMGPNENGQDGRRTKAALLLHAEERQPSNRLSISIEHHSTALDAALTLSTTTQVRLSGVLDTMLK